MGGHLGKEPELCNCMCQQRRSRNPLGCMWGFLSWLSWVNIDKLLKALSVSCICASWTSENHRGMWRTGVRTLITTSKILCLSSLVKLSQRYQSGHLGTGYLSLCSNPGFLLASYIVELGFFSSNPSLQKVDHIWEPPPDCMVLFEIYFSPFPLISLKKATSKSPQWHGQIFMGKWHVLKRTNNYCCCILYISLC